MNDHDFDEIWNRACGFDSPALRTHPGDEALHVALVFHGSVMNGGLLDAVQTYDDEGLLHRWVTGWVTQPDWLAWS